MLWRYFSLSKFLDLLDSSALYFRRIDYFQDKLEATQPDGARHFARTTENPWQVFEMQCVDKQLEIYRNMTFANCWHMNQEENPLMWENYVGSTGIEGVAIQTCFKNLAECFKTERALTNLKMIYVDHGNFFLDYSFPDYLKYLSIKDQAFEYENELRIITLEKEYVDFDADTMSMFEPIVINTHKGEHIDVDLKILIQKLYLAPNSTARFRKYIEQVLRKYSIAVPIYQNGIEYNIELETNI